MFSPQSGELILGRQYKGSQLYASHAEEHGKSGAKAPYDSFIRGWVGTGRQYPHGVIHFAPNIEVTNVEHFEKAFSTLEMFQENGAEGQTVIRGFGDIWEQPLSNIIPDQERSDRVSEVFSIQLSKYGTDRHVWLDLPTTAEQVRAAMGQIGVTQENPWDYTVSGFSTPEDRHLAIPYDMALASGVNELNFLAVRLEKLNACEIGTLNAALQQKNSELRTIDRIADYADNLDYYINLPDIRTAAELGDYCLNRSGKIDIPDAWKPAIDVKALGKQIAELEQGAFTEYGYIIKSGSEWHRVHEGQIVPEEYRVLSFSPPQVERDEQQVDRNKPSISRQEPESPVPERTDTPEQAEPPAPVLTDLQKKAVEIAKRYEKLPLQDRIDIIAQAFGCKTGKIETSPCRGNWRGTSDVSIRFDNGASLFVGNFRTPKTKTVKVQSECVNATLRLYNPEIVQATKETAVTALMKRAEKDNAIAAQKGLKPYTILNVEINDGADPKSDGYIGWYYVTLAVDGKIHTHMDTGLNHDISTGKVSGTPSRESYYTAGGLKEADIDYVFNNVGFSSTSDLYSLPLRDEVRERAEKTLAEREQAETALPVVEPTPESISAEMYDLMCAYDPEFMKNYADRENQISGTAHDIQETGTTSLELVIVGIRDDEQAPAALRERAAAMMDTIDRYKELNNTFSIYQVRGGPETRDFRFESYDCLLAAGRTVDPANYDLVYTAPLQDIDTLENIYEKFNTDYPADFQGHSLSISDVVVLRHGDRQEAHYCDSIGFQEVPEFLRDNSLHTVELSNEQNENMSGSIINETSMLEQPSGGKPVVELQSKARKPQQEKPSILAQLKVARTDQQQKPSARERSRDLEV